MTPCTPSHGPSPSRQAARLGLRASPRCTLRDRAGDPRPLAGAGAGPCVLVGPSGCGKTTAMRHGQPHGRADVRPHRARRHERPALRTPPAAARRSGTRSNRSACSSPHRRRERRDDPTAARLGAGTDTRTVDELLDLVGLRSGRSSTATRRTLRRPAPARRRRPCPRRRPAAAAHGRAVRRDRPDHAQPPAGRVPCLQARAAQDDRVRHPRHRRGGQARRPRRGH